MPAGMDDNGTANEFGYDDINVEEKRQAAQRHCIWIEGYGPMCWLRD